MITLEGFEKINTEKKWQQISLISGVLKFFFLFFFGTSSYNWPTTRFEDCSLSHNSKACVETSDLFLSRQHAWRLRSAPRTSDASCSVNQRLWYHVKRANMTVLISSNVIYLSSICWPLKLCFDRWSWSFVLNTIKRLSADVFLLLTNCRTWSVFFTWRNVLRRYKFGVARVDINT